MTNPSDSSAAAGPRTVKERVDASVVDKAASSAAKTGILKIDPGALATDYIYTFTLSSFRITDTRSPHEDTDYVSMAVAVGNNPVITAPTKYMGNVNNGVHQVNLSIANVEVSQGQNVAFSYAIVNSGHNSDEVEQTLTPIVASAASKALAALGGLVGGGIGSAIGDFAGSWLGKELGSIIFANCDGSVAAGDHTLSGATLAQQAIGATITQTDDNKGSDSPDGCGSNSRYYVSWSITGQAKPAILAEPVAKA
jgi:hypothetical protein